MEIIYSGQEAPPFFNKSIFLVGPTPRSGDVDTWRPQMLEQLRIEGYDGVVFVPEWPEGPGAWTLPYKEQCLWEKKHLEMCDIILAWVPRDLEDMPAFTTNVEFGNYVRSGKLMYGRPEGSAKNTYLDWLYQDCGWGPYFNTVKDIAKAVTQRTANGEKREGGERFVPLDIWWTDAFQDWYVSHLEAGNRLDEAQVLWTFYPPNSHKPFAFSLWVKVWIESEQRHKENEFVLGRPDISTVVAFNRCAPNKPQATRILLVREFRSPVRNKEGFVYELPGGSTFKKKENPLKLAADELKEETGLDVAADRFYHDGSRQLASTFSCHHAQVYSVELSDEEMDEMEAIEQSKQTFGVSEDSEKTYVVVRTVEQIRKEHLLDWSNLGMILSTFDVL